MKTLPSPSTASPVNAARPATNTRWSAAWPGTCSARERPERVRRRAAPAIAPTGGSPSRARSASRPSAWSGWSCVSAIPPAPPRAAHRRGDAVEVRVERRPRIDDPGRVAPDDPGVRPAQRERRRVRRPDEQHLHRAQRGDDPVDRPVERDRRRRGPARPRRTTTGWRPCSRVRRTPRARPATSRADSTRPLQKSPNT